MEEETRTVLPAVALRGRTVLPSTVIHFDINRVRSVRAVENAMLKDQKVFLVTQRDSTVEEPTQDDLYQIGTVALIRQVVRLNPGSLRIVAESQERAELLDLTETERLLMAEVAVLEETDDTAEDPLQQEAMVRNLKEFFEDYCSGNRQVSKDLQRQILEIQDLKKLVDQICVNLSVPYENSSDCWRQSACQRDMIFCLRCWPMKRRYRKSARSSRRMLRQGLTKIRRNISCGKS